MLKKRIADNSGDWRRVQIKMVKKLRIKFSKRTNRLNERCRAPCTLCDEHKMYNLLYCLS